MEGEVVASNTVDLNRIGLHRIVLSFYWISSGSFSEDSTFAITDLLPQARTGMGKDFAVNETALGRIQRRERFNLSDWSSPCAARSQYPQGRVRIAGGPAISQLKRNSAVLVEWLRGIGGNPRNADTAFPAKDR
jgi:hypothetical protein